MMNFLHDEGDGWQWTWSGDRGDADEIDADATDVDATDVQATDDPKKIFKTKKTTAFYVFYRQVRDDIRGGVAESGRRPSAAAS